MTSTFTGLETGKRSLIAHQISLQTLSHNISNADVEGYSRQRVSRVSEHPLEDPSFTRAQRPGQIGQGVEVSEIRRDRDMYLDARIFTETSNNAYWSNKSNLLSQVETIHKSLGEVNLQKKLDDFWASWENLVNNPKEPAVRGELVSKAQDLTSHIRTQFRQLNDLRRELDVKIQNNVAEVNTLAKNIAELNGKIVQSQAVGDNPNDWLDQRDRFVEKLSTLVDISINHRDPNETMIYLNGKILVQGDKYKELELRANPQNEGLQDVYLPSGELYVPQRGQLAAHLEMRDLTLKDQIRRLDSLSSSLVYGVNEVHRQGFDNYQQRGLDFFTEVNLSANAFGNFDLNADGIQNASMIYKVTGNNAVNANAVVGENGTLIFQAVNSDDDVAVDYTAGERISDVLKKINDSEANVNAYLNDQNQLVIRARSGMDNKNLAIKYLEDSGQFLVGITGVLNANGFAGAFDSNNVDAYAQFNGGALRMSQTPLTHPASWIEVNSQLVSDPQKVAASEGRDFDGDGVNDQSMGRLNTVVAKKIADLRFSSSSLDNKHSYNEFYVDMINAIAVQKQGSDAETTKFTTIVGNLKELRQQISGVNLDEEMTNMIAMQHGYQAAARVISAVDSLLDTIINRMAV